MYRGDLCHFHLISTENIADFVTCSSIRAVRARARVCVCVVGDGGGQIYSKSSRWGGGGGGGGLPPLWTNYLKIKHILIENIGYTPNFHL